MTSDNVQLSTPSSTYRLQFRNGMTFDRAVGLIPHISSLGVSHLYASPIFAAAQGSTHGYDVIDPNAIDPEIGDMDGFIRLSDALLQAGLGLILDIVPNHMAASLDNPWWASVVKWGVDSPYSGYFDNDWNQKLTLPVLTDPLAREIAEGHGRIVIDEARGELSFDYRGSSYPLDPRTYTSAFESEQRQRITDALGQSPSVASEDAFHEQFRRMSWEMQLRDALVGSTEGTIDVLERQPWKMIHWQEAANGLSYRRFFEITGLVGVRVEDPAVFTETHRLVLDLVRQGRVQGLRIDHVDGLADPAAYLGRLREAAGPETYIVVEKILEGDETLPRDWPIQGTTGYEFIAWLAEIFTDNDNPALDRAWAEIAPERADPEQDLRDAKRLMADVNFRGEVSGLEEQAARIARAAGRDDMLGNDELARAVRELVTAFHVYRTYGTSDGLGEADRKVIEETFRNMRAESPDLGPQFDFLRSALLDELGEAAREIAVRFRTRLQHLTGPMLAKSLEDTFFYRYNRLIALNEVGGDPIARHGGVDRFHARMQARARAHPFALTATSTHDTKRGEDARARLYAISEAPEAWIAAVARWREMHRERITQLPTGPAPEGATEWLIYQALAGVLPLDFDPGNDAQLAEIRERFLPYLEKALREAKLRTIWTAIDEDYETSVKSYAEHLLSPDNRGFLDDFRATLAPFVRTGILNSLSQTMLKLTAPGIPDIYQGCEGFDFSLVDPDNRRMPDYPSLSPPASEPSLDNPAGLKAWLIARVLKLRTSRPDIFMRGDYVPLDIRGPRAEHVLAFLRRQGEACAVIAVPRLVMEAVADDGRLSADYWADTSLLLPPSIGSVQDALGEAEEPFGGEVPVARLFARRPFALLLNDGE